MPKVMTLKDKQAIESAILPAHEVGKHTWPIEVEVMGESAKLRLIRGKPRISYDWVVPERYQEVTGQARITRLVPSPQGSSAHSAEMWTREWLRGEILKAETNLQTGGGVRDREVQNDVPVSRVVERFLQSEKLRGIRARNSQQADEIERWCAFYMAVLGPDWRLYRMSPDVLSRLLRSYQEPWQQTLPDGSTVLRNSDRRAGHNTAVKVVGYLKTICGWALAEPDGPGQYILDIDPYTRIRGKNTPRPRDSESRAVGVASDAFVGAMYERARTRGKHGQFAVLVAAEVATGRRVGEWRELVRADVMTDFEDVRAALEDQRCRRVLPNDHIPDDELDEAAKAYLALSGMVVRFRSGKQAAADPGEAAQHDRVIPLGPWLTGVVRTYLTEHWEPRGLSADSPLFPSAKDPTIPTHKDLVQTWWERTEQEVAKLDKVRVLAGRTHTLRRRFRNNMRKQDAKVVSFYSGWTLRMAAARDRSYLPVFWPDVVEVAKAAEAEAAL